MAKRKDLTPRHHRYIAAYIEGHGGAESARIAGYSPKTARHRSCELQKNPLIREAIEKAQAALRAEANYNSERALEELKDQIAKATEAKQYSAVARLVELKMKLAGLLTEKKDAPQSSLTLNIVGVDMAAPAAPAPAVIEALPAGIFD